jgi:LysM repeat protein
MTTSEQRAHRTSSSARSRAGKNLFATIPIVLAGSMAVGLGVTGPVQPVVPKRTEKPRTSPLELAKALRTSFTATRITAPTTGVAVATVAAAPATYKVVAGDSVSSIAGRFGLATASVLALNGLGWKSVIFPGQVLKLTNGGAVPVAAAPTPTAAVTRYTIRAGDTMGAIASRFGVPTATLLSANGLGWSSIIYPGQTISIPDAASVAAVSQAPVLQATNTVSVTPSPAPAVTDLTNEMMTNARTIVTVGRSLGVPDYGIVIALATALQESGLRNLNYGDRDSLGLFQQRPSTGWGTPAQVMDPAYSARLFFGGPTNPNRGKTRGLLDIPGWQTKTVAQAAQAVQLSAFPDAYAKWETTARAAFATLR